MARFSMLRTLVLCLALCGVWSSPLPATPEYQGRLLTLEDAQGQDGPIVNTTRGAVLGRVVPASAIVAEGEFVEEFLGIPYSEPPTGSRRWRRPVPLSEGWSGVLNGTTYGPHCIQVPTALYPFIGIGGEESEDCLTVNIYRPESSKSGGRLPVMFFIYGGGYQVGTGEQYPGTDLAAVGDVIVVNFNYRLNTLGFLSTGDEECPGNYGLWDASLALQWVQENIAGFGGDPDRVTIFGQSAGGSAVSHCVLSPETAGLFHRAIPISGSAPTEFSYTLEGKEAAARLADYFNCSAQSSQEIMSCLREQDAEDLMLAALDVQTAMGRAGLWLPVIDGEFIPIAPSAAWRQGAGNIPQIDFMTGNTVHDAAFIILNNPIGLPDLNIDENNIAYIKEDLFAFIRLNLNNTENADELFDLILDEYPGLDSEDVYTRTLAATQCFTDGLFEAMSFFEAENHADKSTKNTYRYVYEYRQSFFVDGYPDWVQGSHLDDMYTFLGPTYFQFYRDLFLGRDFNQMDADFSIKTIHYIANFAYTGNPNTGPHITSQVWPQHDSTEKKYLRLNPDFSVREPDQERLEKYDFWINLPAIPRVPAT